MLALAPAGRILEPSSDKMSAIGDELEPVMLHLTVCRAHLRDVRTWLRYRMHPEDDVITASTEVVMRDWGQIVEPMSVPVVSPAWAAM